MGLPLNSDTRLKFLWRGPKEQSYSCYSRPITLRQGGQMEFYNSSVIVPQQWPEW